MERPKHVFVSWHYTTHGIAYLKHILSAFHQEFDKDKQPNLLTCKNLEFIQEDMNEYFDKPRKDGFLFDEIIYLTANQDTFDKISSRRKDRNNRELEDESKFGLRDCYDKLETQNFFRQDLENEIDYIQKEFPDKMENFRNYIWRTMQYYPIEEQIKWLLDMSNFNNVYNKSAFKLKKLNITNLRDEEQIVTEINNFIKKWDTSNTEYIINISLGSNETQVSWHVLSQAELLPPKTHFIKTYDKKEDTTRRFKPFSIIEVNTKLIQKISDSIKIYPGTKSKKRAEVDDLMKIYIDSGFSILLLGERGIGKSSIAQVKREKNENFITANCASFADDTMAESELFGYKKGAFTGATTDTNGLIKQAENGILFLDEIHHLSKRVQAKLMTALQTDDENNLSIRRVGASKTEAVKKVQLIFATNKDINELRQILLPDFYDRIVQQVIELPPLRESPEDRKTDWNKIWKQLKFKEQCPNNKEFDIWLKNEPLYGNYRDIQKIAIYYHNYLCIKNEQKLKDTLPDTALDYVKDNFYKYGSKNSKNSNTDKLNKPNDTFECCIPFGVEKQMLATFHEKLRNWAISRYGTQKKAAKELGVDIRTLTNWKNKSK